MRYPPHANFETLWAYSFSAPNTKLEHAGKLSKKVLAWKWSSKMINKLCSDVKNCNSGSFRPFWRFLFGIPTPHGRIVLALKEKRENTPRQPRKLSFVQNCSSKEIFYSCESREQAKSRKYTSPAQWRSQKLCKNMVEKPTMEVQKPVMLADKRLLINQLPSLSSAETLLGNKVFSEECLRSAVDLWVQDVAFRFFSLLPMFFFLFWIFKHLFSVVDSFGLAHYRYAFQEVLHDLNNGYDGHTKPQTDLASQAGH